MKFQTLIPIASVGVYPLTLRAQANIFKDELKENLRITKELLRPTLSTAECAIFDQTRFIIEDDIARLSSPHAGTDLSGKPVIVFSTGFYRALCAMGDLALIELSGEYGDDVTGRWFAYAIPRLFTNARLPSAHQSFIKWPGDYFRIPQEEVRKWHADPDTRMTFTGVVLGCVSLVLAHEKLAATCLGIPLPILRLSPTVAPGN